MKTPLITFPIFLFSFLAFGQMKGENGIKMISELSSDIPELRDILYFERIDYFKIKFVGKELVGKDYLLIVKEIWNGEIKTADTLVNTSANEWMNKISSDSLSFKVIAKKQHDDKIKMFFRFPAFGLERKFEATQSDAYSLRSLGTQLDIKENENFYALAYILPYEKEGMQMYCAVDSSGKEVESWGKEFGIEHYLVFVMKFQ